MLLEVFHLSRSTGGGPVVALAPVGGRPREYGEGRVLWGRGLCDSTGKRTFEIGSLTTDKDLKD